MNHPEPANSSSRWRSRLRAAALKILRVTLLGIALAVFYDWGSARFYTGDAPAGFWRGAAHGALMPMALPALLAGRDVPIYAERNTGRGYKLGYICGINACGLVVFGTMFLGPRRRPAPPLAQ